MKNTKIKPHARIGDKVPGPKLGPLPQPRNPIGTLFPGFEPPKKPEKETPKA